MLVLFYPNVSCVHTFSISVQNQYELDIPYSAKFLWVFNFANFQPFAKIFQRKFLTCSMQCACAVNLQNYFNEISLFAKI